jgi:hypothetical protein
LRSVFFTCLFVSFIITLRFIHLVDQLSLLLLQGGFHSFLLKISLGVSAGYVMLAFIQAGLYNVVSLWLCSFFVCE